MVYRRPYDPRKVLFGLLVFAGLVMYPYLRAKPSPGNYEFGGNTMGTYFKIQIADAGQSPEAVKAFSERVEDLLETVNRQMSTYDPESQISRFNASSETNVAFSIAPKFARVASRAVELTHMTGGAFDPTIGPLVNAWGFSADRGAPRKLPTTEIIAAARNRIGIEGIHVTPTTIRKTHPGAEVDLSAIAKGYAADALADLANRHGYRNVFVEVGGEIAARGTSPAKTPWRVAIEVPRRGASVGSDPWYTTVTLSDAAIATSGDYRNYFEIGEKVYGHILDPRTGFPVSNRVASVSVIARDCMTADAVATALSVMGPDEGMPFIEQTPGMEALFILHTPSGEFEPLTSDGFAMEQPPR